MSILDITQTSKMHVIVNITTKQSLDIIMHTQTYYCSFCGITMWSGGRAVGPMPRPGARGLGPGLGLNYYNCVAGRAWTYFLRAGSGQGRELIIQFAARAGSAQLLGARAGPGPQIIFLRAGPGPQNVRAVQGPRSHPSLYESKLNLADY